MRLLLRVIPLAILGLLARSSPVAAQVVQYRTADGRDFASLPDTGMVAAAMRTFRRERTLENALALGAAQSSMRAYREAVATYTDALKRWPNSALLYRWRGHRHLTLRDFIHAREDLQTAIDIDSTLYGAWYHLGVVEFVDGEFDAAAQAFRRGIRLAPDAAERAGSTDWLWQSLSRGGRTAAADSLLRARPDSVAAGNAYEQRLRLYRGEVAPESLFTAADTAGIQRATLGFGLASWYAGRGEVAKAREWFELAYHENAGWPSFGFIAAEAQLNGRTEWSQRSISTRPADACFAAIPEGAMTREVVHAVLAWPGLPKPTAGQNDLRQQIALFVQEVASTFRQSLGASSTTLPSADGRFGWQQLDDSLVLTVQRDGRAMVERPARRRGEDSVRLAGVYALADAVEETLRSGGSFFVWPAELSARSISVGLTMGTASDTSILGWAINEPMTFVRFPLFSQLRPPFRPVSPRPDAAVPPYPYEALRRSAVGSVRLKFVVDTTGMVAMGTVREIWPIGTPRQRGPMALNYDLFRRAVLDAMPKMRFLPAEVGGCKFAQLVQQPFVFDIQR